jgi:hypothetical protein
LEQVFLAEAAAITTESSSCGYNRIVIPTGAP